MSWFSSITDAVATATESVKNTLPIDKELLDKLTLNTDEMKAEREHLGDEAARKEAAKDMLASMFPWETKDVERDILVDECKEAILALSTKEETFYGPYEMPDLDVQVEEEDKDKEDDEGAGLEDARGKNKHAPSEESLEKLAKLEPLPPLLQEFDLDCHVGLIQMLLKEDPNLVQMHSQLSGGGSHEMAFWRNYFFHCAFTRYEAGLSIDEIWSFNPESPKPDSPTAAEEGVEEPVDVEDQVVFNDADEAETKPEPAFQPDELLEEETAAAISASPPDDTTPTDSMTADYDFLDEGDDQDAGGDPELDELEAEIMKELEN